MDMISFLITMIGIKCILMPLLASEMMIMISTKLVCLRIETLRDRMQKHAREPKSEMKDLLHDLNDIIRIVDSFNADIKKLIFDAISVLMPIAAITFAAAVKAEDTYVRLFVTVVGGAFYGLMIMFVSAPIQVHTSFKSQKINR